METYRVFPPRWALVNANRDKTVFEPDQTDAIILLYNKPGSDQPSSATIGPVFFESYHTLSPNIKYIHGFNFNYNETDALERLETVSRYAFESLGANLLFAEVGNESDLAPGRTRPLNFTADEFATEWNEKAAVVSKVFKEVNGGKSVGFIAPSFAWDDYVFGILEPNSVLRAGLGQGGGAQIREIAMHKYVPWPYMHRQGANDAKAT